MSRFSVFLILLALLSACSADQEVQSTAPSPDGSVQASIVTEDFGATVAEVSSVRIRRGGKEAEEVLRADHVQNLALRWKDKHNLEIAMDCGRIFNFTNFSDAVDEKGKLLHQINIRLANTSLCDTPRPN